MKLGSLVAMSVLTLGFLTADVTPAQKKSAYADTVVLHGKIYTVNSKQPWAEALAIRGERVVAVGSNSEIAKLQSKNTQVIDAQGRLVLPGFTDCHIHFIEGSFSLGRVNLEGAKDPEGIQQRLRAYGAAHPGNDWILGRGWNYAMFPSSLPDKKYLDEVFPDRPAFLEGYDGHTYWANSKALELAHITKDTRNPPNGIIVRDPQTGEATGALKEAARSLVAAVLAKPTRGDKLAALRAGIHWANQNGLSRVHSAGGDFEEFDLYDELLRHGDLTLRFYIAYFQSPPELRPQDIATIEEGRRKYTGDWLSAGAVKFMIDGVVESHTAAMLQPYTDDPSVQGKPFWQPENYRAAVTELDRRGLQIFTHAIGDSGVRTVLDSYQSMEKVNHTSGKRPRIEHVETIAAQDIPGFGKLGVIASMQPLHSYPDDDTLNVWARNIGPDRASRAWVWKSIANDGGQLAFGSDWPVVTLNPFEGIQTAVTRQTAEGLPKEGFLPSQRLSVAEAIRGYTLGAAYAGFREKTEGSLEPGKLADLIILSQDVFEVDPRAINQTKVLTTIVGGRVVFESR
ncbi:MAG TPA: amidohydrolase [Candidatus Eisenbacteria bacterium]|nr:amidohydrolase [Candidatus Eisenbacteria bacterium]